MRFFAFVLAVLVTFTTFGNNDADSVKVYFRVGQRQFDASIGDNRENMDRCIDLLRSYSENDIDSIIVRAYTSPDGSNSFNERLARQRCNAISDYIIENAGINRALIRRIPEGIAWDGLRDLVRNTPDVPRRDAVLEILDNMPVWVFDAQGKVVDGRKSRLMKLDRGIPYNWMLNNLFPQLRNAVAIIVVTKEGAVIADKGDEIVEVSDDRSEPDSETVAPVETPVDSSEKYVPAVGQQPADSIEYIVTEDHFALKTNFLYYAVLLPNIEFEWRVNQHWSLAIEGDVAWYGGGVRKYRLAIVTPEARYHFRSRGLWHGMYVGAFAGPTIYDLENKGNGYEGEGFLTGVSAGYVWPIGKHLSLEAAVGIGYLYTRYKEYKPFDGHFLYQRTKDLNYVGPLKLKLSLVWHFGHKVISENKKSVL